MVYNAVFIINEHATTLRGHLETHFSHNRTYIYTHTDCFKNYRYDIQKQKWQQ